MSEEQQDHRIDDEPSDDRKAELEAAYQQNIAKGKAPYDRVDIRTHGELLWVIEQRHWSKKIFLQGDKPGPNLSGVNLKRVNLSRANLERANLSGASLYEVNLSEANLGYANLSKVNLINANLSGANLPQANMREVDLTFANLNGATLRQAKLSGVALGYANLSEANLMEANLSGAFLREANLSRANLERANLSGATLNSADLTKAKLNEIVLDNTTKLGDIIWDGVNLSLVNWEPVQRLGDDNLRYPDGTARAYRQVATQLRSQGMNEVADRFAYLAQLWQRRILRQRLRWTNPRSFGPYLGSLLLWIVAGYGYRPGRTFLSYLVVVLGFAALFFVGTHNVDTHLANLTWNEALILSLTSFHGRGFFPGSLPLGDWAAGVAAAEAVIGLFIELILIATFSRRFLGN